MQRSIYLARLMSPVLLAVAAGLLLNGGSLRAVMLVATQNVALIFISGLLTLTAGIAIVLAHNVWEQSWRVIITVLGWLFVIGGIVRIVTPEIAQQIGTDLFDQPATSYISAAIFLIFAVVLGIHGYPELTAATKARPARRRRKS